MEETYKKSKGNAGQKGVQFQLDLVTVCLLNALRNHKNWKISSENPIAGKYDDIVVELTDRAAVLIQAKHKENRKITKDQLLSDNSKNADFSLPKYFFSYEEVKSKFRARTVIICTNTAINTKGLEDILTRQPVQRDSVLYHESDCSFYSFNENILPDLKRSAEAYLGNNSRDKEVDNSVITEENLKDFLENLQFFSCYPCEDYLHKVIQQSLSYLSCSGLCRNISSQELLRKVEDWFQQPKGEYLTEARAKAMLCEIRSDKYCESLKDFNVSFSCSDLDISASEGILIFKANEGYLLQMLNIYSSLQTDESRKLFVNPDDAVEVQKTVVEAFSLHRYKVLIMAWVAIKDETAGEIISKVERVLEKDKHKTVILVAGDEIEQFGLKDICQINKPLTFKDLSNDSHERLLRTKNVLFQGCRITLGELLHTQAPKDCAASLDSAMLEKLLRGEEFEVGVQPLDLDEETARYYINRRFATKIDERGDTRNILTEENLYDVKQNIIVISDSAGMGKSTVLIKMAVTIKESNPSLWVMKINLSDYTRVLRDIAKTKRNRITAAELLNSLEATKMTKFEKIVFSMSRKVVLMLDGVDEISPEYTDLVLNLLSHSQNVSNFAKIFVTTRPHVDLKLKDVGLFHMIPFTRLEQRHFLTNYWTHNLYLSHEDKEKCKQYAEILVEKMSSWTKSSHYWQNPFTDIPMQVRMLAEIFQENIKGQESGEWEGCKEYLESGEAEPKLPEKFNIAKLYDTFVEKKRDVFIEKGNPAGIAMATVALFNQFEAYLAYHRSLSVRIILPECQEQFKTQIPEDKATEEYILRIGIVQRFGGHIHFIHRTFAEYFLANSIVRELQLLNPDANFQRLLIDIILRNDEFEIVRAFLDILLERHSPHPNIFKQYRSLKCEDPNSKLIFKLAEEGHVAILRLILESVHFKVIKSRSINVTDWRLRIPFRKKNTLNDLAVLVRQAGVNIKRENWESPLHLAAKEGHLEMVHFLLEQGADVNMKDAESETALHRTTYSKNCNIVKCLVEHGADVNLRNYRGYSVLFIAVSLGASDIVAYLLDHGADINVKDREYDTTLLHLAAYQKNWDIVECLVEHGVDVNVPGHRKFTALHYATVFDALDTAVTFTNRGTGISTKTGDNNTALRLAIYQSNWNFVKYLVRHGTDAKVKDNRNSALHANHLKIIECLIRYGADVNAVDDADRTVLHFAVQSNKIDIVVYVLQHGANVNAKDNKQWSALHYATYRNSLNIVRYLAEHGADVNASDNEYCTPLHYAVRRCDLSIVEYLIEHGPDFSHRNRNDFTTMRFAAELDQMDVVEYFLQHGADIAGETSGGNTPLHVAIEWNNWNIVKYLVIQGADVNARDVEDLTALHFTAKFDKIDKAKGSEDGTARHLTAHRRNRNIFKYLLKHGADKMDAVEYFLEDGEDVNRKDSLNNMALLHAACKTNWNIVKCLVEHGADVNDGVNGYPVLHFAVQFNEMGMVGYLLEHGANINARNINHETALHLATYRNNVSIVKCLVEHGADVNAKDDEGRTALDFAVQQKLKDIVDYLVPRSSVRSNCRPAIS